MTAVLFVTVDAGGNLPPGLEIARAVVDRGGSARFLGSPTQRRAIEKAGFDFEPYATAPEADSAAPGSLLTVALRQARAFADRRIGRDTLASLERRPADVVVVDTLLVGGIHELMAAQVPVVTLVHTLWSFFHATVRGPFGLLIRAFGGGSASAVLDTAPHQIVTVRPEFESPTDYPAGVEHVGMVWQGTAVEAHPDTPRVLVSLSTTTVPGQRQALQRIMDALADLPLTAVVTTGPAIDPAGLRAPANVELLRYVDHAELLPRISLVIGHGGHGTTLRGLAHGIPALVLPMNALIDQPWIARAVERLGVGRMLSPKASVSAIREAVTALLADGPERAAARAMGVDIRERDGAVRAAEILEEVGRLTPQSPRG
jgi:UDP:flavonoid glycosyltransferase YjiC (YdhE family)